MLRIHHRQSYVCTVPDSASKRPSTAWTHHWRVRAGADDEDVGTEECKHNHVMGLSLNDDDLWRVDQFVGNSLHASRDSIVQKLITQHKPTKSVPRASPAFILGTRTVLPLLPDAVEEASNLYVAFRGVWNVCCSGASWCVVAGLPAWRCSWCCKRRLQSR
jgi:hypothetical protein